MQKNYNALFGQKEVVANEKAHENHSEKELVEPPKNYKDDEPVIVPKEPKMATVDFYGLLNVRQAHSLDTKVLCMVAYGSRLVIIDVYPDPEWAHIRTESGIEGYVMSQFIKED